MPLWQVILIAFAVAFGYKLLSNVSSFLKSKYYLSIYEDYINRKDMDISMYQPAMKKLIHKADIDDACIAKVEPVGYGKLYSTKISVIDNSHQRDREIFGLFTLILSRAKGVFLLRIKECFSPFYWLDCALFFPKHILDYLGLSSEKVPYKLLNIMLTFLWWVGSTLVTLFHKQISLFIVQLIDKVR